MTTRPITSRLALRTGATAGRMPRREEALLFNGIETLQVFYREASTRVASPRIMSRNNCRFRLVGRD
jgi:hypothetical protein